MTRRPRAADGRIGPRQGTAPGAPVAAVRAPTSVKSIQSACANVAAPATARRGSDQAGGLRAAGHTRRPRGFRVAEDRRRERRRRGERVRRCQRRCLVGRRPGRRVPADAPGRLCRPRRGRREGARPRRQQARPIPRRSRAGAAPAAGDPPATVVGDRRRRLLRQRRARSRDDAVETARGTRDAARPDSIA